jgi:hypothetical protein
LQLAAGYSFGRRKPQGSRSPLPLSAVHINGKHCSAVLLNIDHGGERPESIPHSLFEGGHVTRDIPSLLTQGGFQIEEMKTGGRAKFPKSWTYWFW